MLHIDDGDHLNFEIDDFVGARAAVLGSSGFGKSNTVARLCEQLLPHLPMVIVDPHSEYWGLQQKFEILIAGRSEHVNLPIRIDQAGKLAEISYHERMPVILDLLHFDADDERPAFVHAFFARLWELGLREKRPYGIVLEEAHNFIPEQGAGSQANFAPVRKLMKTFAQEGRKFGFGFILSTQSTTEISKTVLKQCEMLFLHGVNIIHDVKIYQQLLPFEPAETKRLVYNLDTGDAIVKYKRTVECVHIALRETFHVGATPLLGASDMPELRQIDAALLDGLVLELGADESPAAPAHPAPDAKLQKRVLDQERLLDDLRQQLGEKPSAEVVVERVEVPVLLPGQAEDMRAAAEAMMAMATQMLSALERIAYPMMIVEPLEPPPAPVATGEPAAVESVEYKTPLQTVRGIKRQEREFEALLAGIRSLSGWQRKLLRYLIDRSDRSFSVPELSRFLGVSVKHIVDNPPLTLIAMGLIARSGRSSKDFQYRGTAHGYLSAQFPDLNTETLFSRLLEVK